MWLSFCPAPSLCIILHPPLLLFFFSMSEKQVNEESLSVCWQSPGMRKGWSVWPIEYGRNDDMPLLRSGCKRQCGFYLGGGCSLHHQPRPLLCLLLSSLSEKASCHVKYGEPTWWGTEASGQHPVRNWGLPTTMWVGLEVDLPIPSNPMMISPAYSLVATSWETLSQNHQTNPLLHSQPLEKVWNNNCCLKLLSLG